MRKWWRRRRRSNDDENKHGTPTRSPLREFVYLDDVSLRSLLASQKGELTEHVTELLSKADEAELASAIGASSPVLKADVRSRYRTTTNQGTQTSRKAIIQSLFKELLELEGMDVALRHCTAASEITSIGDLVASNLAVSTDELRRGRLVEIEVELTADPIFRLSTIASELTDLMRDFPELLEQPGTQEGMANVVPGTQFIQRFLAGLIPIRARATSHVVIDVDGVDYVVPADDATTIGLTFRPLSVVGVTEQDSYWRDVRTVLFSSSRFTMLCRIAHDGLRSTWEPVKLADVLKEVLPTFPDLMADIGRTGLAVPLRAAQVAPPQVAAALEEFIDSVEASRAPGLTSEGVAAARQVAAEYAVQPPDTLAGQNGAFRLVIAGLRKHGCTLSGDEWLDLERRARGQAGLGLFGQPIPSPSPRDDADGGCGFDDHLLDTEVIAIYW